MRIVVLCVLVARVALANGHVSMRPVREPLTVVMTTSTIAPTESVRDFLATDPDLAKLAQESEPDYYKRVFTEYLAARKAVGNPDEVSFENFIAKLKVNEGKLKAQFQCRAVRFRVITKDNKVSLKPVPIYADGEHPHHAT